MTKKIPDYLRLHREDLPDVAPEPAHIQGLTAVCRAFRNVTGWKLDYQPNASDDAGGATPDGDAGPPVGRLVLSRSELAEDAAAYDEIQPLAQALGSLVAEIHRTRHVIWQREAELAAGIPVAIRADDQQHLAIRLESVLRGGAEAIGCQAAALYLLDDATSHLKLRACWRLPKTRFLERPRSLRGAVADLEALVGHAVALENTSLLPHWKAPEDFPAALCVPVSTASTPLGTLWFFADQVRDFTVEQTHMAEIIAGRLVSDLEREVLVREGFGSRQLDQVAQRLASWQRELRPSVPPLIDGWQMAGCTGRADGVGGGFYDWCVLRDGRIALAIGHAEGPHVDAALTASTVQLALKSHADYPHEPRQMVDRLNETVWTHSTGNRFSSVFYAIIDPGTGESQFASAGQVHSLRCTNRGCQTLTQNHPPLGVDPDARFRQTAQRIGPGESLVVFCCREKGALDGEVCEKNETKIAALLQTMVQATAAEQVDAVSSCLTDGVSSDCSVVVLRCLH